MVCSMVQVMYTHVYAVPLSVDSISFTIHPLHLCPCSYVLHGNGCYLPYWCAKAYMHTLVPSEYGSE